MKQHGNWKENHGVKKLLHLIISIFIAIYSLNSWFTEQTSQDLDISYDFRINISCAKESVWNGMLKRKCITFKDNGLYKQSKNHRENNVIRKGWVGYTDRKSVKYCKINEKNVNFQCIYHIFKKIWLMSEESLIKEWYLISSD